MADPIRGSVTTLGVRAQAASTIASRVLVQGARAIVERAEGPWPVKTGRSKASLSVVFDGKRVWIEAIYYAPFIYSHGVQPWTRYVLIPLVRFVTYDGPQQIGQALIAELVKGVSSA